MRELRPGHEERWFEIYRDVALTGQPIHFEQQGQELEDRWIELHAFRIGAPEQKRVGVLFMDISERKRFELALRDSEERLRLFTENVADYALLQVDTDARISGWNSRGRTDLWLHGRRDCGPTHAHALPAGRRSSRPC
jgi:PAS domain-containing protein